MLPTVKEEILETVVELFHIYGLASSDRNSAFTILGLKTISTISSKLSADSTKGSTTADITIISKLIDKKVEWNSTITGFTEIILNVLDAYKSDIEILRYCTEIMAYITEVYLDIVSSRRSNIEKDKYKRAVLDASGRVIRILQAFPSSVETDYKQSIACFGYRVLCNLISNGIVIDVDLDRIFNLMIDSSSTDSLTNEVIALYGTRLLLHEGISTITVLGQGIALVNTLSTQLSNYRDNEILLVQCLEGLRRLLEQYLNFERSTSTGILPFEDSESDKFTIALTKDFYGSISVLSELLIYHRRVTDIVKRGLHVMEIITTGYSSDQVHLKVYSAIQSISTVMTVYCDGTTTNNTSSDSSDSSVVRDRCLSILLPLSDRIKKGSFKDTTIELVANMFRADNNPYDQITKTMKLEVEKALRLLYELSYDADINQAISSLANEAIELPLNVICTKVNVREQKKFEHFKYACNAIRLLNRTNIIIYTQY